MKFSIIVPIYNVSSYLTKCLDTILKQTYKNFEVILVNDGSTDTSSEIIDKYVKLDNRFKRIDKKNGGLSSARNRGVKEATGDYIIFVDSDDYINKYLLKELNDEINENDYDIVRYRICKVEDNKEEKDDYVDIKNLNGKEAFLKLLEQPYFVTAWSQAYKRSFWIKNKFEYAEGRIHEDFGLTPIVYLKAKKVSSINVTGYYYIIRKNSIMTSESDEKQRKRNEDLIYHFNYLLKEIDKIELDEYTLKNIKSFLANAIINRCKDLSKKELTNYLKEIKKYKIGEYLIDNTLGRKLKKLFFKLMPKMYIKLYLK